MEPRYLAATIIFSMLAGVVVYYLGWTKARLEKYTCTLCGASFILPHQYEWHLISFCDTQCMDEECTFRLSLGADHSIAHHTEPL